MRRLLLAAALLACACGRRGAGVAYRAADGSFRASLPGDWRVDETHGDARKAALYGPPGGDKPFTQLIGVYFHAAADPDGAARAYVAGSSSGPARPPREIPVGAGRGYEALAERRLPAFETAAETVETRTVAVPAAGGFFSLEHTWPKGSPASPAFDELLKTFEPAAAAKK